MGESVEVGSRLACTTQLRIAWADGSNSFASSSGVRPAQTVLLTVLHRLMVSGSDRACVYWRNDYRVEGIDALIIWNIIIAGVRAGRADPGAALRHGPPRGTAVCPPARLVGCAHGHHVNGAARRSARTATARTTGPAPRADDCRLTVDQDGWPVCSEMWPGNPTEGARPERKLQLQLIRLPADHNSAPSARPSPTEPRFEPFGRPPRGNTASLACSSVNFFRSVERKVRAFPVIALISIIVLLATRQPSDEAPSERSHWLSDDLCESQINYAHTK
jgi:hypothetical protein